MLIAPNASTRDAQRIGGYFCWYAVQDVRMVEATVGWIEDFATTIFVLSTMLLMGLELTIDQLVDFSRSGDSWRNP